MSLRSNASLDTSSAIPGSGWPDASVPRMQGERRSTPDQQAPLLLAPDAPQSFDSFWMAGFEGADHINAHGVALAMNQVTQHQNQAAADYQRLDQFAIRTVRESVGWRLSEKSGKFDFSTLDSRALAAQAAGVQVIWTLLHYGWPDGMDILSPAFVKHFARYAGAAARHLSRFSKAAPVYVPIHEISYLAWAICETDFLQTGHTDLRGRSLEVKRQLVRAALAACDAIWKVDPRARIMHTDPLIHVAAPHAGHAPNADLSPKADLAVEALRQRECQFQAWDMLCGRLEPELGGHARYLDLVGLDYYPANQWELGSGRPLDWYASDPRRAALADLLQEVHDRYTRPLLIAETGHQGVGRAEWMRQIAREVRIALARGIPLEGVCLYPVIDRPDWHNSNQWLRSGLWDLLPAPDGTLERRLNQTFAQELRAAQVMIAGALRNQARPVLSRAPVRATTGHREAGIAIQPARSHARDMWTPSPA
jgi:hypothetical protein